MESCLSHLGAKPVPKKDPFDWPAQNRADLMNLQVLNPQNDGVHTRTQHYRQRTRQQSSNLQT